MEASILSITRRLGVYGPVVLLARGMIEELPRTAPGQLRRFLLCRPLPHERQFEEILREHYSRPAPERIESAFAEFEKLAEEMATWYGGIPERLLPAERLERVGQIAHGLADLEPPVVPPALTQDPTFCSLPVFMAPELGTSRTVRHANAVRSLLAVAQVLRESYRPKDSTLVRRMAADSLAADLLDIAEPLQGLVYPTRYS